MITPMHMPAVGPASVILGDQNDMTRFRAVISNGIRRASYKLFETSVLDDNMSRLKNAYKKFQPAINPTIRIVYN